MHTLYNYSVIKQKNCISNIWKYSFFCEYSSRHFEIKICEGVGRYRGHKDALYLKNQQEQNLEL